MSKKRGKKKSRITNRQAKIRQKKKKPDKKLNPNYKRLNPSSWSVGQKRPKYGNS